MRALSNEREHGTAVLGVLWELLLVCLVLLDGPHVHLTNSNNGEEEGTPAGTQEAHRKPCNGLKEVVGERNEIKAISIRNLTGTRTRRTKIAQGNMGHQVGQLCPLEINTN